VRARRTQAALKGLPWNPAAVQQATAVLQAEFTPISDMRASARYRKQVLGNLLQRFWLESQGATNTSLENILVVGEAA
jgi:xanthine dehydrogenase small subunit